MKGFIVKTKLSGESDMLKVAIPNGNVKVWSNFTRYGKTLTIGGEDENNIRTLWKFGYFQSGDEIHIEFTDIDESSFPIRQENLLSIKENMVVMANDDDNDKWVWQHKLDLYYRLKAILESENLI